MVKIAIAGGSGNVGQEILDVLVAANKHEILILSRKDAPAHDLPHGTVWIKTSYEDTNELAEALKGVHTVLSFIGEKDPESPLQRNLIDAAVQAGVKRFAPSEWASASFEHMDWYAFKATTRKYLEELNKDKKVLEYCLFQPGWFTNYFTKPYKSTNHITQLDLPFDFNNRRILMADGSDDDSFTLTTVQDIANVVARAIDYEGEWPVVGGIKGTAITLRQLVALGERVRGGTFKVERLNADELKAGTWTSSWLPIVNHPSIPLDKVEVFSRIGTVGILLAIPAGALAVTDEWNRLLPDYKFTQADEFLSNAWQGKP